MKKHKNARFFSILKNAHPRTHTTPKIFTKNLSQTLKNNSKLNSTVLIVSVMDTCSSKVSAILILSDEFDHFT